MAYIVMAPMYKTMTSGKVDKYLVKRGDKVKQGTAVAEGYFTLLSEADGIIKEFYVEEGEYVEVGTPLMEIQETK